jgi:phosphate transport system substrate-binding protein
MNFRILFIASIIGSARLVAADAIPAYKPQPVQIPADATYVLPDGSVQIVGNDGMEGMLVKFNELFTRTHPGIKFTMLLKGSSTGVGGLTAGVSAFAPMGRDAWPTDLGAFKEMFGYEVFDIRIGRDGYTAPGRKNPPAFYVHSRNPLASLTIEQAARIFTTGGPKSDLTHWRQLGLKGEWGSRAIHVYGMRDNGGLATAVREFMMGGRPFSRQYEPLADHAAVIRAVAQDPFSIAFIGFFESRDLPPEVRMLPLSGADGQPSVASYDDVVEGRYPLTPFIHLYANRAPGRPLDPLVREYARMVLSKEGQDIIASLKGSDEGYVPLSASEVVQQLAALE